MTNAFDPSHLLLGHLQGTLTPEEAERLADWLESTPGRRYLAGQLDDPDELAVLLESYHPNNRKARRDRILRQIASELPVETAISVHRAHFLRTAWFRYAAVLLLIAGTATFLYLNNQPHKDTVLKQPATKPADILPGGNKAILTLADGSTIVLDSAANGSLARQGGTKIIKLNAGSLAYQGNEGTGEIGMNTIRTPKGGQYQISLPDGSKVWLNAASSISFPTAFVKSRNVTITGEVYFEVTADKAKPFAVSVNGTAVNVLGTSFNINAYPDEPSVKTSLLTGSVQIGNTLLKPGQALLNNKVVNTNIEQDLAWKNGYFNFEGANLQQVMRQIARWYDIEVVFSGKIPERTFVGELSRGLALNDVLTVLQSMRINYHMDTQHKRLTILP